jgi:hypothetical protein
MLKILKTLLKAIGNHGRRVAALLWPMVGLIEREELLSTSWFIVRKVLFFSNLWMPERFDAK